MDKLWAPVLLYFKTDEAKREIKTNVLSPLGGIIYNEIYIYIWIICFYHIFLILLVFSIFVLILRQPIPVLYSKTL
jgi:hypothetical protein